MNGFMHEIDVYEWSLRGLELAIDAGLYAGLLAAAVLVIHVLMRRWLSANQMGMLWGLVLVRLLLPIAPASPLSLQHLVWPPADATPAAMTYAADDVADPQPGAAPAGGPNSGPLPAVAPGFFEQALDVFADNVPYLWLAGAVGLMVWTVGVHARFCAKVRMSPACRDERLLQLWATCCQQAGVRGTTRISMFDGVGQPAVMGVVRPRLLLPSSAADLDDLQLRMIMLHELAHVRRWDIAVNWMLVLVRAVQWWNPVYWLATARFLSLREQACDAFVIRRIDAGSSRGYSELLLLLAGREPAAGRWHVMLPASILGFLSNYFQRRTIRNRIRALRGAGTLRGRWHTTAVAALTVLVAAGGLTDARTPVAPSEPSGWLPKATVDRGTWSSPVEVDLGPLETRVYAIDKALGHIAEDRPTSEQAALELKLSIEDLLRKPPVFQTTESASPAAAKPDNRPPLVEHYDYTIEGPRLLVEAPRKIHEELARNLQAWEESGLGQICIECRFITAPLQAATAAGLAWRYHAAFSESAEQELAADQFSSTPLVRASAVVNDYFPVAVATLDPRQAKRLVASSQGDRRANVLQAPKITLFNGRRATIADSSQTPFVVGIRENSAGVQEPRIAVLEEGTKVTLRARQNYDRGKVRLNARLELSQIGEVYEAATTVTSGTATIQLPRLKRCSIDIASEVNNGESVLIGCVSSYEEKRFLYVLLTVQNIES